MAATKSSCLRRPNPSSTRWPRHPSPHCLPRLQTQHFVKKPPRGHRSGVRRVICLSTTKKGSSMKTRILYATLAAAAVSLSACVVAPAPPNRPYYGDAVMVAPPPPRTEYAGPPPAAGVIWIGGYWNWTGRRHDWVPGRWEARRPGSAWVDHRWERDGDHWRQCGGRWEEDRGHRDERRDGR